MWSWSTSQHLNIQEYTWNRWITFTAFSNVFFWTRKQYCVYNYLMRRSELAQFQATGCQLYCNIYVPIKSFNHAIKQVSDFDPSHKHYISYVSSTYMGNWGKLIVIKRWLISAVPKRSHLWSICFRMYSPRVFFHITLFVRVFSKLTVVGYIYIYPMIFLKPWTLSVIYDTLIAKNLKGNCSYTDV